MGNRLNAFFGYSPHNTWEWKTGGKPVLSGKEAQGYTPGAFAPVLVRRSDTPPYRTLTPEDSGYEERPITHVYRGMTHAEWGQALEKGYIKSDSRGCMVESEGTNAAVDPETAEHYAIRADYLSPTGTSRQGPTRIINGKHFTTPLPHLKNVMTPLEHAGPMGSPGVIVKIRVHPDENWVIGHDNYARTREKIPISRVEHVGTVAAQGRGHIVPFEGYEA